MQNTRQLKKDIDLKLYRLTHIQLKKAFGERVKLLENDIMLITQERLAKFILGRVACVF